MRSSVNIDCTKKICIWRTSESRTKRGWTLKLICLNSIYSAAVGHRSMKADPLQQETWNYKNTSQRNLTSLSKHRKYLVNSFSYRFTTDHLGTESVRTLTPEPETRPEMRDRCRTGYRETHSKIWKNTSAKIYCTTRTTCSFLLDIQRSPRGIYSAEHFWKILNGARNRRQREDGELKSGLQSDSADGVRWPQRAAPAKKFCFI